MVGKDRFLRMFQWMLNESKKCPSKVSVFGLFRTFSVPYFPTFGLNTARCEVSLCIHSKWGKVRTRKTPNADTFHAVSTFRRSGKFSGKRDQFVMQTYICFF